MKYVRIELKDNETRLVYQRGMIYATSQPIQKMKQSYYRKTYSRLDEAYTELKREIRIERTKLRGEDKLSEKSKDSILSLLRQKRAHLAEQAFTSKKPVNKTKHIGVEIEFISNSSRREIARDLAMKNLTQFVELKHDGSVSGDSDGDCDGSCREDCECSYCNETHYCDDESECMRRTRNYEGRGVNHWEYREDCTDCDTRTETEEYDFTLDDGTIEVRTRDIEVSDCQGHCDGHSCGGYDDHPDYDCNCECNCCTDNGHEIAIVAKSSCIANVITQVCEVLASHGATVNDTCGLHVHLDMRRNDPNLAFANLVRAQNVLYSMVPETRYKSTYCRPNNSGDSMDDYTERYHGVNPESYDKYKTIEVRLHSGTVNAVKINNWIKLLKKIAYSKRKLSKINSVNDLTKQVVINNDLLAYINERIEKFKKRKTKLLVSDYATINIAA